MKCNRCGSGVVYEKFFDAYEPFLGSRCIFCGEISDWYPQNAPLSEDHPGDYLFSSLSGTQS